jgi:16S rRNA (guanine527-N7)-methyltransferase
MSTVGAAASETPDPSGLVLPPTPAAAAHIFGPRWELAERYVALLADTGITHGLIGPREAPRLWDRHVLNCAVVAPHFAADSTVIDIGSGAGLPGLVFAIARPDLTLVLIEPLARRCRWLETAVATLGLTNVVIHNLRAEAAIGVCRAPYVTARAVARIDALARWSFPLLEANGSLVALKGQSAQRELDEELPTLKKLGGGELHRELLWRRSHRPADAGDDHRGGFSACAGQDPEVIERCSRSTRGSWAEGAGATDTRPVMELRRPSQPTLTLRCAGGEGRVRSRCFT